MTARSRRPHDPELNGILGSGKELAATITRLLDAARRDPRSPNRALLYGLEQAATDAAKAVQAATDRVKDAAHDRRWIDRLAAGRRFREQQQASRRRAAQVAVGTLAVVDVLALWLRLT